MNYLINDLEIEKINNGKGEELQISFTDGNLVDYQIEMINNNAQQSLLSMKKYIFNGKVSLNYDITGLQDIVTYFKSNTINKSILLKILTNICDALLESGNFFLEINNHVLDINHIYINPETLVVRLVYIPVEGNLNEDINTKYRTLVKEIIVDYAILEDNPADSYMQVLLNNTKKSDVTVGEFKEIIAGLSKGANNFVAKAKTPVAGYNEIKNKEITSHNVVGIDMTKNSSYQITPKVQETVISNPNSMNNSMQTSVIDNRPPQIHQPMAQPVQQPIQNQGWNQPVQAPVAYNPNGPQKKEEPKEEESIIKEVYKPATKIIAAVMQPLFIAGAIGAFFVSSFDMTQKCVLAGLCFLIDGYICFKLFDKKNKIKVRIKNTAKVKAEKAPKKGKKGKKGEQETAPVQQQAQQPRPQYAPPAQPMQQPMMAPNNNPSVNLSKREVVSQLTYDTEVLDDSMPYLILSNGGVVEKIFINKDVFTIGRMPSNVDYVLPNKAVGKQHIQIIRSGQGYFVQDLNSKNGTFVNDQRLVPNSQVPVNDNDKVRLANVEMIFKMV